MKAKQSLLLFIVTTALLLSAAPASASGFSIFGAYWDTDDLGDVAGGGIAFGIPVSGRFDIDLRATYYEELVDQSFSDALDALFDDDRVFERSGVDVIPIEVGVRYNFNPEGYANGYVGGGAGYYLLDSDFGELDDEFGPYVVLGGTFGRPGGIAFFVEGIYRKVEGSVEIDPQDFDDIDDIDFIDDVDVDLDGLGANAGIIFRF